MSSLRAAFHHELEASPKIPQPGIAARSRIHAAEGVASQVDVRRVQDLHGAAVTTLPGRLLRRPWIARRE